MLTLWNNAKNALLETNTIIERVLPALTGKDSKELINIWNKYKKTLIDIDKRLTVKPIDVKLPFKSDVFTIEWQIWKEYLAEQHSIFMSTRSERSALLILKEWSENDEAKAIYFLRFAMARHYRSFFKVKQEAQNEPPKDKNHDSDF